MTCGVRSGCRLANGSSSKNKKECIIKITRTAHQVREILLAKSEFSRLTEMIWFAIRRRSSISGLGLISDG